MADEVLVTLDGVDDLVKALRAMPEKIRKKAVSTQLRKAALLIRDEAKQNAPVIEGQVPRNRTRGLLRRKISVRPSKFARNDGDIGFFVGVRPAKGAKFKWTKNIFGWRVKKKIRDSQRGADSPLDPYYWRFVEFDRRIIPRSGPQGYGTTTYTQRLRNGRVVTRTRRYSLSSITGRRRNPVRTIPGKAFLRNAVKTKGGDAIRLFIRESVAAINSLNRKGA